MAQLFETFLARYDTKSVKHTDDLLKTFFAHYGVPGMKWGRRRSDAQLAKAASKRDGKVDKNMTTKDLQARVNRIRLEQEYAKLTTPKKSPGKQFLQEMAIKAGKQAANDFVQRGTKAAVNQVVIKAAEKATGADTKAFLNAMAAAGGGGKKKK